MYVLLSDHISKEIFLEIIINICHIFFSGVDGLGKVSLFYQVWY